MDLRTAEVLGGCKWVCQGRLLMQLVMQRIAALYLAIALEGFDAAASLCQTCQGGSVGQPCLGQESRSYHFSVVFFANNPVREVVKKM